MNPLPPESSTTEGGIRWEMAGLAPALTAAGMHLWYIDTSGLIAADPGDIARLSARERNRAERLVNPTLRAEYTRAHSQVRQILALYLHLAPAEIAFSYSETGKPSLETNPNRIEFNLTTVTDLSLLAVARGQPLGIDCERIGPRTQLMGIARRMFPAAHVEALLKLSDNERLHAFYKSWTALEAAVKVDGRGLARRSQSIPLDVEVQHFIPADGLISAVAGYRLPTIERWRTLVLAEGFPE